MAFLDADALDKGEIPVLLHRSTKCVSGYIAEARRTRSAVRNQTCCLEAHRIQVVSEFIGPRAACVNGVKICALPTPRSCTASRLTERAATCAVSDRERQTTLVSDDAADGPTFEELVVPEATIRYRQVVRVADYQTMRPVEITARLVLE